MNSVFLSMALCLSMLYGTAYADPGLPWENARQMIVVTTADWQATSGRLQLYQRDSAGVSWSVVGDPIKVVVGAKGMGWGKGLQKEEMAQLPLKREGDLRAPAGVFSMSSGFGYASRSESRLPYIQATADIVCVDDKNSAFYNQIVHRSAESVDWNSAEKMLRKDGLYALGVVVDNNPQRIPDAGSCVFLHVWRSKNQPTAGCTAMSLPEMKWVQAQLDPARHPVLVQLPEAEYRMRRIAWQLP